MNGGIGMMDRVTDSIRPKRLMVLVQSNGIMAMLNEIRESIYKYSYADWHRMLMGILDEMEAKL